MSSVPKFTEANRDDDRGTTGIDRRPGTYPLEVEQPKKKRASISFDVFLIVLGFVAGAVAIWTIGDPSIVRFFWL